MLEHLAATASDPRPIALDELLPRWQSAMRTWRAWMCTQTKHTLEQVRRRTYHHELGGSSNAMSLRSAAALGYYDTEDAVVLAAKTAMFTHREETAHAGAEFFARVTFRVLHQDLTPLQAIEAVAADSGAFVRAKVAQALAKVEEAVDPGSNLSREPFVDDAALTAMASVLDLDGEAGSHEPIKVGLSSATEGTLPGAVYFIVKYGTLEAAAKANAKVGGDNASRGVAIGMVLGAAEGLEGIPASLGEEGHLVEWERVASLLDQLPLIRAAGSGTARAAAAYGGVDEEMCAVEPMRQRPRDAEQPGGDDKEDL